MVHQKVTPDTSHRNWDSLNKEECHLKNLSQRITSKTKRIILEERHLVSCVYVNLETKKKFVQTAKF